MTRCKWRVELEAIVNKVKRGSVFVEGVNGDEYVMVKTNLSSLVYLN